MRKYWLYLNSDTFVWKNTSKILLYNSATKIAIEFSNSPELDSIVENLCDFTNLYCIQIDEVELSQPNIKEFTSQIVETNSGFLSEITKNQPKPIQFPPLLNLQCDRNKLKQDNSRSIGEKVTNYLNSVDIYFTHTNNPGCKNYIYQLEKFLGFIPKDQHVYFNIILEDYKSCESLDILINTFKNLNTSISLQICSSLIKKPSDDFNIHNDITLKIVHDASYDEQIMVEALKNTKYLEANTLWHFDIHSESEYDNCSSFIERKQLKNTEITPVYNGKNLAFFEENIYLTKEDLRTPNLDKRKVFANQAINTNNFGKIIIQPDGNIYSDEDNPPLGNIHNSLKEILTKEMELGTSWFRVRDMEPCNRCVYQWLCPSPSNYETEIGKPNLCHIEQ